MSQEEREKQQELLRTKAREKIRAKGKKKKSDQEGDVERVNELVPAAGKKKGKLAAAELTKAKEHETMSEQEEAAQDGEQKSAAEPVSTQDKAFRQNEGSSQIEPHAEPVFNEEQPSAGRESYATQPENKPLYPGPTPQVGQEAPLYPTPQPTSLYTPTPQASQPTSLYPEPTPQTSQPASQYPDPASRTSQSAALYPDPASQSSQPMPLYPEPTPQTSYAQPTPFSYGEPTPAGYKSPMEEPRLFGNEGLPGVQVHKSQAGSAFPMDADMLQQQFAAVDQLAAFAQQQHRNPHEEFSQVAPSMPPVERVEEQRLPPAGARPVVAEGSTVPHCPVCYAQLEVNSRFCGECGLQMEARIPPCPGCGIPVEPMAKFCGECGFSLR